MSQKSSELTGSITAYREEENMIWTIQKGYFINLYLQRRSQLHSGSPVRR